MSNVFRRSADAAPPVAVRAEGSTIWDADGRAYLDAAGGAIVVGIGHGRESVARVMAEQAGRVAYAHGTAFTSEPLERYAAALAAHLPMDDPAIYPVSGGSEAMESALKLARSYHVARGESERWIVIRPMGELPRQLARRAGPLRPQAAATPVRGVARPLPPRLRGVPVPRGRARLECPRRRRRARRRARARHRGGRTWHGRRVRRRADRRRDARGRRPAGRVLARDRRGLPAARRPADRRRGHDRLRADRHVVRRRSLGRPARTSSSVRRARPRATSRSGSSRRPEPFATPSWTAPASSTGSRTRTTPSAPRSPARCSGSSRTSGLVEASATKGDRLRALLDERLADHPNVGEIRGRGLLIGLELVADRETRAPFPRADRVTERVVRAARDDGLLLYSGTGLADGTNGDAILLGPPFVITEPELERLVDVLAAAIGAVTPAPVG